MASGFPPFTAASKRSILPAACCCAAFQAAWRTGSTFVEVGAAAAGARHTTASIPTATMTGFIVSMARNIGATSTSMMTKPIWKVRLRVIESEMRAPNKVVTTQKAAASEITFSIVVRSIFRMPVV